MADTNKSVCAKAVAANAKAIMVYFIANAVV